MTWPLLLLCALVLVIDPAHAPIPLVAVLLFAGRSLLQAFSAVKGTALRPALIWGAFALALALFAQLAALTEPLSSGRPLSERFTYLCVLAILAALCSVLGARTPGGKAWAILMALLVVVFLIPWLEDQTRLRRGASLLPLHLDAPWSIFYGLLVAVAVTNYLPTRFGWASAASGALFVLEYIAIMPGSWPAARRALIGSWIAWTLALVLALARSGAARAAHARCNCERLWFWFRDNWGVVWALRVLERFNRAAEVSKWPVRLTWFGLMPLPQETHTLPQPAPEELEATFRILMKRFADPWRLSAVTTTYRSPSAGTENQTGGETAANSSASSDS